MKFKKFLILFLLINCSFIFSQSPIVSADGKQLYCPGTKLHVATSFSITAGGTETGQPAIYIQISEGYVNGQDELELLNPANHPNVNPSFDSQFGKLTIQSTTSGGIIDYADIERAILDVVFSTTSNSINIRKFSITIGEADYLPSNDHYYRYIEFPAGTTKTWEQSRIDAESTAREYYGRQGYLVTLRSELEAILASEQAPGRGWIGASDTSQEGKWEWVTEPAGSVHFWSGNYADSGGTCDNLVGNCQVINGEYNNWENGEPNDYDTLGGEDYGHIYTSGKWNDYPNSRSDIKGYIVEYGGRPGESPLTITDFTEIQIPQITSKTENETCGPGQVILSAETNTISPVDPTNDVRIEWYDQASGGTLVARTESGQNFNTPVISSTTDYYIQAVKFDGTSYCSTGSTREKITATFSPKPFLVSIPDVEQCNDTVFDLEDLQDDISSNYTNEVFEFFDSSGTLIASPSNYQLPDLTISNEELITVVVKNDPSLGSPCDQTITFTLRAGACDIPSTFPVLDEAVCETSTDPLGGGQDGFETFDKTIFSNIEADLIAAEPLFGIFGTEINFFRSDADAQAGVSTTAIDKTVDYTTSAGQGFTPNATENRWEQELWVRVENTTLGTACFDTQQVATLYINKLPELLTATVDVNQCDVGIFNLTDQEDNLSLNYADEVFEYYDSTGTLITDPANYTAAGLNEIVTVTINTTPSIGTACINTTASINLAWSVTTLPSAYTLIDEYLIETDPDPKGQGQDGIETFDKTIFATVQADLIVAEPAFSGKTFSFYRSQNDALTSSDKIDTTVDFTTDKQTNAGFTFNTAENRWEQQIWVYIEDSVTTAIATCYGLYQIATVYVEKRPVFYDVVMQELCDAETPLDMYSLFDTSLLFSEFTTDPTGSVAQNTSLFTVEYTYVDDTGAAVTLDPVLPLSFNSGDQTITVTLTNNSTNTTLPAGVSSGTIEFKVYQQPVAYPSDPSVAGVYTFEECDDDNDGLALGEEVFDMSTIKTDLLTDLSGTYPAQDPGDFDFEFSVAGSPITLGSDYTATTGDQIEVTITNPLFTSCEETITIDFVVNPLPSFDIDDPTVICLNPLPGQPVEIGTSKS